MRGAVSIALAFNQVSVSSLKLKVVMCFCEYLTFVKRQSLSQRLVFAEGFRVFAEEFHLSMQCLGCHVKRKFFYWNQRPPSLTVALPL
jgi:hypothetical protein